MQGRLPRERRHGHVQGRVHGAPLRRSPPTPRSHYAFGGIYWWSRLASHAPRLVNWLGRTRPLLAAREVGGGRASPPHHADLRGADLQGPLLLRARRARTPTARRSSSGPTPSRTTCTPSPPSPRCGCCRPSDISVVGPRRRPCAAAAPSTTSASWEGRRSCCGRRWRSSTTTSSMGVPVVGVEPSCVAAFRDELRRSSSRRTTVARRMSRQTWLFGEFLDRYAADVDLPRLGGTALLHGHCHQRAVLDFDADRRVLDRLGIEAERARVRMLRDGRPLRLRARPLRCEPGVRGAGAPARGTRPRRRRDGGHRRLQLPDADRAEPSKVCARSTWQRWYGEPWNEHGMTEEVGRPRRAYPQAMGTR